MKTSEFHPRFLAGLLWLLPLIGEAQPAPPFTDVTALARVTHTYHSDLLLWGGSGMGILDFDGDGELDIIFPGGDDDPIQVFRGLGNWEWEDLTDAMNLPNIGTGKAVAVADYDNDGDPDFLVTSYDQPPKLFQNQGGSFLEVAAAAGITSPLDKSTDVAWADVNQDGFLDLFIARYTLVDTGGHHLHIANGDGTFTDQTLESGLVESPVLNVVGMPSFSASLDVQALDADNDGDLDLMLANDRGYAMNPPSRFWRNNGQGHFTEEGAALGLDIGANGMGLGILDINRDGFLDIFLTNTVQGHFQMMHGCEGYQDLASVAGTLVPRAGWGVVAEDLDLDGWPDLYVAHDIATAPGDHWNGVFMNQGDGTFQDVGAVGSPSPRVSTGVAAGDFDGDGDPDLVVVNIDEPAQVLRNELGEGHWLQISLEGVASNRDGIGARIEVDIPGATLHRQLASTSSYLSSSQLRVFFGLGDATIAERVTIHWPSGTLQTLFSVNADQVLHVLEEAEGPSFPLADERCGDAIDNDCDGITDLQELGTACLLNEDGCFLDGTWECDSSSFQPLCLLSTVPEANLEHCGDGIDNDCDGLLDEGFENLGTSCTPTEHPCDAEAIFACGPNGLTLTCTWLTPDGLPPHEKCGDRVDNDCDGLTDEDFPSLGTPCQVNSGIGGAPTAGVVTCDPESGAVVCEAAINWAEAPPDELPLATPSPTEPTNAPPAPPHSAFAHAHANTGTPHSDGCQTPTHPRNRLPPLVWPLVIVGMVLRRKVDLGISAL